MHVETDLWLFWKMSPSLFIHFSYSNTKIHCTLMRLHYSYVLGYDSYCYHQEVFLLHLLLLKILYLFNAKLIMVISSTTLFPSALDWLQYFLSWQNYRHSIQWELCILGQSVPIRSDIFNHFVVAHGVPLMVCKYALRVCGGPFFGETWTLLKKWYTLSIVKNL